MKVWRAALCLGLILGIMRQGNTMEEASAGDLQQIGVEVKQERAARRALDHKESILKRQSIQKIVVQPYAWNDITLNPSRLIASGQPVRVLALDGGGSKGITEAVFLKHLEEKTGRPIAELFDLIIGTSTGGILAVALTTPDESGKKPKYSAEDMVEFYRSDAEKIFTQKACCGSFFGLCGPSYKAEPLEELLAEKVMDQPMSFSLVHVAVTAVNTETNRMEIIASYKGRAREKSNFFKRDACRATSAAPTYFEPATIAPIGHPHDIRSAIDGGLGANNPAMCGVVEAIKLFGKDHPIHLLSLGTGEAPSYTDPQIAKKRGLFSWAKPIIQTTFDAQSFSTHYMLEQFLTETGWGSYYRFQANLSQEQMAMDNAGPVHLRSLEVAAERMVEDGKHKIRELLEEFWGISAIKEHLELKHKVAPLPLLTLSSPPLASTAAE